MSLRMLFIGSSIDGDGNHASALYLIRAFAAHPQVEKLHVLGLRVGRHDLPDSVTVRSLDYPLRPTLGARIRAVFRFYVVILGLIRRRDVNVIHCYMAPIYPFLLHPIRFIFRTKVSLWYAHASASMLGRLSISYCVDRWFASTRAVTPFDRPHLSLVGTGVNQQLFHEAPVAKEFDFITVGRLSQVKHMDMIIEALARCRERTGRDLSLLICGAPVYTQDIDYQRGLVEQVNRLGLDGSVNFAGRVEYETLPNRYRSARCFVFATPGGIGRVVLEAMSCALPVIVAEPEAADFFPHDIAARVLCNRDTDSLAAKMAELIQLPESDTVELGRALRRLVDEKYNVDALVDRMVVELVEAVK